MSSSYQFLDKLFDGPIDIVGDIHGEYGALVDLLDRLGYDDNGDHKEGRRVVFVGDLVDRGPDSISVVELVQKLCKKGKAQCIIGNHELNIMNGHRKHGNHWFWNEPERICKEQDTISFQRLLDNESKRKEILSFLGSLPLVLENDKTRVVHAAYDATSMQKLLSFKYDEKAGAPASQAFNHFANLIKAKLKKDKVTDDILKDLATQNDNPVKVLTSGFEAKTDTPFFAGGKQRYVDRVEWWNEAIKSDGKLTIIGHYWRRDLTRIDSRVNKIYPKGFNPTGRDMFDGYKVHQLIGKEKNVMCVDFAAGVRYEERGMGLPLGSIGTALGALRLPEMSIIFDDGRSEKCS